MEVKLDEARAQLDAAEAAGNAALVNAPAGVTEQDLAFRRVLFQRLVRLLEQQQSNAVELDAAKKRAEEAARDARAWTRFDDPPPYSVLLTDQIRDEIDAENLKYSTAQAALPILDALLAENRAALDQAEEKIRQLNEQLEGTKDRAATRLSWDRDLQRVYSQIAAATLGVLTSERQLREQVLAECRVRLDLLQRQVVFAAAGAKFTQADLNKVNDRLDRDREQYERELDQAETKVAPALQALNAARVAQQLMLANPNAAAADRLRADQKVAKCQAEFDTAQAAVRVFRFMLETVSVERTMWGMRFAAYDATDRQVLIDSRDRLESYNRRLDLWRDLQRQQMEASPSQLEMQELRLQLLPEDSDLVVLGRQRLAAMREYDQLLQRLVRRMEQLRRLSERWGAELRANEGKLPFLSRVRNLFSGVGSFLWKLWTFELFTAEDTITVEGQTIAGKRSITLGKVIMAVFFAGLAIWVTGLIARLVEPLLVRWLKMEANQASVVRRWVRALLVVFLLVFGLALVKIPLTVFAFAGGALAIGLGFGMQNMLKNFVSGALILFERPFRIGDIVDVSGQQGTITGVGLRASVLELWDGTETIIPNSALLENNLTNWTYSNRTVRFSVKVGVAYGSDPRKVTAILAEAAERHGLVVNNPKPIVLFAEFGPNALIFELRFWVDVTKANAAQVSSELRLMIAAALAERGIVVALPQRDVHLTAAGPIPVSVVPGSESPAAASQAAKRSDGEREADQPEQATRGTLQV